jgi:hypothetical protein
MRVLELWRHPVKSIGGERIAEARITELGIDGDRRWGVVDDLTGHVLTARRAPRLLMATATLRDGAPVITTADGDIVRTSDDLAAWLGRPATLTAAGDDGGTYENPRDPFGETDWMRWQGPGRAWHDSTTSRVSIVSTGSLGEWDARRFRANVVVDGAGEDDLVGRSVRLGTARLNVTQRIERCVMVTRPQPALDRDLDVLRAINAERDACLAIGALVTAAGTVGEGDELVVAGDQPSPASDGGGR